jgi:hypothetical protein
MAEISQSRAELEAHLAEQLQFLETSGSLFDSGNTSEAKRLAATLRLLFHDARNSHALLGQLNRLGAHLLSTAAPM